VCGADTGVYPPMSDMLRDAGVEILEGWDPARLAALAPDLVVVGNAVSRGHPEVEWLLETNALPYVSLPELLRTRLLNRRRNIVVAGTHGKTTTTSLTAALLRANGAEPGWLVGGAPRDLPAGANAGVDGGPFVIEGDEYDTAFFDKRSKFVQYLPRFLIINNIEFDHADIFRDLDDVLRAFTHVTRVVPRNGAILANGDDPNVARVTAGVTWCPVLRVGTGEHNDLRIADFTEDAAGASFRLLWRGTLWREIHWKLPGEFNARNAAMAALSSSLALSPRTPLPAPRSLPELDTAILATVQGVRRRQDIRLATPALTVIEDFGHHPTAIRLTLETLRRRYPRHVIHAAFEPRSNTSVRRILQNAFRDALALADAIYIAPVHRPERLGDDVFDTAGVAAALRAAGRAAHAATSAEHILALLREATGTAAGAATGTAGSPHLVVFFSNGAFGGIIARFAGVDAPPPAAA
ncbi:MAG: Mur ligase, partial [Puniceicoccales bacterium]|nr:Mur ligase [Puniceicoccales bacterium]